MRTLKKLPIRPVFLTDEEYMPSLSDMDENTLYISRAYKTTAHKCLCGCGEVVYLCLIPGGWYMTEQDGKVSILPSIGNYNLPCKSHYVITNNVANVL